MTPTEYSERAAAFLTPEAKTPDYYWLALASECLELYEAVERHDRETIIKEIGDVLFFLHAPGFEMKHWPREKFTGFRWNSDRSRGDRVISPVELVTIANIIVGNLAKMVREPDSRIRRTSAMCEAVHQLGNYMSHFPWCAEVTLAECAQINLDKLAARKAAGTICGDGDNR